MASGTATLKRTMVYSWELFYEQQADGTRILRHIRVNNTRYQVPDDGVIVDIGPDTVGTEQIIDESVAFADLDSGIQATLNKASELSLSSEADVRAIVTK